MRMGGMGAEADAYFEKLFESGFDTAELPSFVLEKAVARH